MSATTGRIGFLLDVDNTLFDNDALKDRLASDLRAALGDQGAALFWQVYEEVRHERDVVDLPGSAHRYAQVTGDAAAEQTISALLDALPFAQYVLPHAIETLHYLETLGPTSILSDGDLVFQVKKIERSGLAAAVDGRVLIYTHKEQHLQEVAAFQPVEQTVLIDDKARILDNVKRLLGERVTTVHVLQGHYAREPLPAGFTADITVPTIGDVRTISLARFLLKEHA